MTDAERQNKFAEIVALTTNPMVTKSFVQDAYAWKKETYGEEHADGLLDRQIEFLKKRGSE